MIGKTMDQITMEDTAELSKTVTETDVYLYAGITGDFNPAHINETYAAQTFFKSRIAHGGIHLRSHRNHAARAGNDLSQSGT